MLVFCTLFDSNYLNRGIALYRSLINTGADFRLYILPMDEKAGKVINDYGFPEVKILDYEHFIDSMKLQGVADSRKRSEFCWTCTSFLIDYILTRCNEEICTYLDSDLWFYNDPQVLIDEMGDKDVQIVEHRLPDNLLGKENLKLVGTYCVQFNTFKNTERALDLLRKWEEQCLGDCSISSENHVFGDQRYLEGWEKFDFVSVLDNPGGGVAPWNVSRYKMVSNEGEKLRLKDRKSKRIFELVFYHFHNITYKSENTADISVYQRAFAIDDRLIGTLYPQYLRTLSEINNDLSERYEPVTLLKEHPAFAGDGATKSGDGVLKRLMRAIKKRGVWVVCKDIYVYICNKILAKNGRCKNVITF